MTNNTDYFHRMGDYLAFKIGRHFKDEDLPYLRQWLDDAPRQASPQAYGTWGKLLGLLGERLGNLGSLMPGEADDARLRSYLVAMEELDAQHWWFEGKEITEKNIHGEEITFREKSVYQGFEHLCYALGAKEMDASHPMLLPLVESRLWDPSALLLRLDSMRREQMERHLIMGWGSAKFRHTAQGAFLKALRPLLLDTTWRPKDMGIYGDMWSVHANARGTNYLRQEERARKFIKTLAQCTASQTHKALQALLDYDAHHVDDKCVADFFPLRLSTCPAQETLEALIALWTERDKTGETEKAQAIQRKLYYYHPEVHQLLCTHFSIFPEVDARTSFAQASTPAFDALWGRAQEVAVLPDNVLGSP